MMAAAAKANQITRRSSGRPPTNSASGMATQRLVHLKQSKSPPQKLPPTRRRIAAIMPHGPSSWVNKCVTRHVASTASTNRKGMLNPRNSRPPSDTTSGNRTSRSRHSAARILRTLRPRTRSRPPTCPSRLPEH